MEVNKMMPSEPPVVTQHPISKKDKDRLAVCGQINNLIQAAANLFTDDRTTNLVNYDFWK